MSGLGLKVASKVLKFGTGSYVLGYLEVNTTAEARSTTENGTPSPNFEFGVGIVVFGRRNGAIW